MAKTRSQSTLKNLTKCSSNNSSCSRESPKHPSSFTSKRPTSGCLSKETYSSSPIRLYDSTFFENDFSQTNSLRFLDGHLSIMWDTGFNNSKWSRLRKRHYEAPGPNDRTLIKREDQIETIFKQEYVPGNCIPDAGYEHLEEPTISKFSTNTEDITNCESCNSYSRTCVCPSLILSSPNKVSLAQAACDSLPKTPIKKQEKLSTPPRKTRSKSKKSFIVNLKFEDNSFLKVLQLSESSPIYKLLAFQKLRTLERMKVDSKYNFEEYPKSTHVPKYKRFAARQSLSDISRLLGLDLFCPLLVKELVDLILDIFITLHSPGFPHTSIFDKIKSLKVSQCIRDLLPYVQIYIPCMTYNTLYIIIRSGYDRKRLTFSKQQKRFCSRAQRLKIKKE